MRMTKTEFTKNLQTSLISYFESWMNDGYDEPISECPDIIANIPSMGIQQLIQLMCDNGFELEYAASLVLCAAVEDANDIDFSVGAWQSS